MAQLAIKGHATRGSEVIALLEMLEGKNNDNYSGSEVNRWYFINSDHEVDWFYEFTFENIVFPFTLEEFEEKFPYKVGDKVQHKGATSLGSIYRIEKMNWADNKVLYTICNAYGGTIKSVVEANNLQPYKEQEIVEENKTIPPYMDYDIKTEEIKESVIKWQTGFPEEYGTYLVTIIGGEIYVADWIGYEWDSWLGDSIIAWCPLSNIEPYKE